MLLGTHEQKSVEKSIEAVQIAVTNTHSLTHTRDG